MNNKIVMLYGANCPPCNALKPLLASLCGVYSIELELQNAAEATERRARHNLRAVPAVIKVDHRGVETLLFVGGRNADQLVAEFRKAALIP